MTDYKDIKKIDFANISDSGNEGTKVATGTTAERGATEGQIRYNTSLGALEFRNASGYFDLDDAPSILTCNVTEIDSQSGSTTTFTITGTNFVTGINVKCVGSDATEITANSVTRNSRTSLTAVFTDSNFANAKEPYDVKIINPNGKSATLDNIVYVDSAPYWNTTSGNIADIDMDATGTHATLSASDPDGDTIAYSVQSGSIGGLSLNSSTGVISGDPTDVGSDTTYNFTSRATANGKFSDRAFNIIVRKVFTGGNFSVSNLDDFMQEMAGIDASIAAGGTLTVNGAALGSYDYYATTSDVSLSSGANMNTYFTNTQDTKSACLYFGGNLTINSGLTFTPPVRKLFTAIYVAGNLVINGQISMSSRGANHSGDGNSGGYTAPAAIRMRSNGETIPATGGAGGARQNSSRSNGFDAGSTPSRGTGGGGGGGPKEINTGTGNTGRGGGAGSAGTSFSGGTGGGGNDYYNSYGGDGTANGGTGGSAGGAAGNGAGNPAGSGGYNTPQYSGTGGTLIIFCEGTLSGSGSVRARPHENADFTVDVGDGRGGGGAGGGTIQVFCSSGSISSSVTRGDGQMGSWADGGHGGNGSVNIMTGYTG